MRCFIRKNTPELRTKLEEMGYHVCTCASFADAMWLNNFYNDGNFSIHGLGFDDEGSGEAACGRFLAENKTRDIPDIDCGEDEELFLEYCQMELQRHKQVGDVLFYEDYEGKVTPAIIENTEKRIYYDDEGNSVEYDMYYFAEFLASESYNTVPDNDPRVKEIDRSLLDLAVKLSKEATISYDSAYKAIKCLKKWNMII